PYVAGIASKATPTPQTITPVGDPDPLIPPAPIVSAMEPARWIDPSAWARVRALDRYALAHEHRRAVARNEPARFTSACDAILAHGPADRRREELAPTSPSSPLPPRTGARAVPRLEPAQALQAEAPFDP